MSVSTHVPTPRSAAERGRLVVQRDLGLTARQPDDLDVAQRELPEPDAHRLHHRFLGREARREARHRLPVAERVLALGVAEEPLGDARPPLEREPEPVALDQVDADPQHDDPRHRTVGCHPVGAPAVGEDVDRDGEQVDEVGLGQPLVVEARARSR